MKLFSSQRFLMIYSGVLTLALALIVLGAFRTPKKTSFDEIDAHRINILEPNGLVRMVISDKAKFPGAFINGNEIPHPDARRTTGMLFLDDEGTEIGGLVFGGRKDKNGKVQSVGHLSFDRYNQDQIFTIEAGEEEGKRYSTLKIDDRSDFPMAEALKEGERIRALPSDQQKGAWDQFERDHPGDVHRILLGRTHDKSAELRLKDTEGRDRIVLRVNADGNPSIQLLDASGKVVSHLPQPQR